MSNVPPPIPSSIPQSTTGNEHAPSKPQRTTLFHQAARSSWIAPLIAIVLGMLTISQRVRPENNSDTSVATMVGYVNFGLITLGPVLAIFALLGIRRHGWRGILIPSVVGLLIAGFFGVSYLSATKSNQRIQRAQDLAKKSAPILWVRLNAPWCSRVGSDAYKQPILSWH